jgi:hypothetical protein
LLPVAFGQTRQSKYRYKAILQKSRKPDPLLFLMSISMCLPQMRGEPNENKLEILIRLAFRAYAGYLFMTRVRVVPAVYISTA